MNSKESCASRIKKALEIRDMTQSELCKLTNIPKSAMSQYCAGTIVPRQDRTFAIASALNVSEAWLMGFDVPMDRETLSIKNDALKFALFGDATDITDADMEDVRRYAEFIKERKKKDK